MWCDVVLYLAIATLLSLSLSLCISRSLSLSLCLSLSVSLSLSVCVTLSLSLSLSLCPSHSLFLSLSLSFSLSLSLFLSLSPYRRIFKLKKIDLLFLFILSFSLHLQSRLHTYLRMMMRRKVTQDKPHTDSPQGMSLWFLNMWTTICLDY